MDYSPGWAISNPKRWCCESAALSMPVIQKTQQYPQDWKRSVFFQPQRKAMPKHAQTTTQLYSSHTSKVAFKILQDSLQQYVNHEIPDIQAWFRKSKGTKDQSANICWIIEKRVFHKNIYFCFVDYAKSFDCVDHNKLWNILQEMGKPDHLACLLTNLYAGQEATLRTGHGPTDWFQIRKWVCQGCILSPCLFNLHAEYIMQNARLDEAQAAIKISRRNTNNFRYADNSTLMAESEEDLKSLLTKVKEESEIVDLKLNIQKTKIMASGSTNSWQIYGERMETMRDYFWRAPKSLQMVTAAMKLKDSCSLEEKLWPN